MKPFYIWFAAVTLFLVAAVTPLPFSLPTPWTGIVLAVLVLSVSALPFAYGRVYIVSDMLEVSRESSIDGDDSAALIGGVGDNGEGTAGSFRLDEDGVFGRESYPLLGSTEGEVLGSRSLTWKQCLQDVRFWVLFLSFLCSAGSGLVVINNIASLAQSLDMISSDLLVRKTNPALLCAGLCTKRWHSLVTRFAQGQAAGRRPPNPSNASGRAYQCQEDKRKRPSQHLIIRRSTYAPFVLFSARFRSLASATPWGG